MTVNKRASVGLFLTFKLSLVYSLEGYLRVVYTWVQVSPKFELLKLMTCLCWRNDLLSVNVHQFHRWPLIAETWNTLKRPRERRWTTAKWRIRMKPGRHANARKKADPNANKYGYYCIQSKNQGYCCRPSEWGKRRTSPITSTHQQSYISLPYSIFPLIYS